MNRIKRLIKTLLTPRKLFFWYLFVNMIPSIFLLYTEPLNITGKLVLFLFPLGTFLIIYSLSKRTGLTQLLLIPLLVLHAFQLVVFYLFGEDVIAVDMFLNLASTNPSEAGELLNSLWPAIIFVCILYIPTIIAAIIQARDKIFLDTPFRKRALFSGLAVISLSFILSFSAKNINMLRFAWHRDVYPVDVFYNLKFAINKWHKTRSFPVTSADFSFKAEKDSALTSVREICVLVIGETSRAENWSLYGYERETNPQLGNNPNLVVFQDAITQSNVTHKSVSIMLSSAAAENYDVIYSQKSVIDAFEEAGATTVFLSNQGDNNMLTQYFAESADYYHNIRSAEKKIKRVENHYDDALLPLLEHYVDSIPGDLFIVLHTYGSHFNYNERYPEEFSLYTPDHIKEIRRKDRDKLVNAYDNSILYTDDLLSRIANILNKDDICSSMLYISDHGEDIMDDRNHRFLHASPNPSFYQLRVPVLIWFSPEFQSYFPEKVNHAKSNAGKPIASNAIFHTLLDIYAIHTPYLDEELSLVNSKFKIQKRMYLDDHDEPVFFYDMNLKKEDKEMIDKRNIHH